MCSLVCITDDLLPRHLRGFDLLGAKSGVTTGETAIDSDTCGDASGVTAGRDRH
jgi:hypothetical protein